MDECQISSSASQPENQFVQEQDHAIVLQSLRMLADHRQSLIERQELFVATTGLCRIRSEIL